jgi:hypothetical protein
MCRKLGATIRNIYSKKTRSIIRIFMFWGKCLVMTSTTASSAAVCHWPIKASNTLKTPAPNTRITTLPKRSKAKSIQSIQTTDILFIQIMLLKDNYIQVELINVYRFSFMVISKACLYMAIGDHGQMQKQNS